MNANVMDYSYSQLDLPFKKVLENLLTKAVRVTTAVKDKIKNGYKKHFTVAGIENQQVELVNKAVDQVKMEAPKPVESIPVVESKPMEAVSTVVEDDYLVSGSVDETAENLGILYDKLIQLQNQKNVLMFIKRAAAYTKELIDKTYNVTKKWFADFNKVVSVADAVGPTVMPELSIPSIATMPTQAPISVPSPTVTPVVEPTPNPTPVPTVEKVPSINSFSWDNILNSTKPKTLEAIQPEVKPAEMPITKVNEFTFEMPTFDQKVETNVLSPAVNAEVPSFEFRVEPTRSNVLPFEKPKDSLLNISKKDDSFPTRGEVTARIYRLGETIKEGNARIARLSTELEAAKAANTDANKKVAAYDQVNSSLSSKIISLTEQLSAANADLEKAKEVRTQLMKSHEEEKAQMKADFDLAAAKASEEKASLIADYENKLALSSARYRADITKLNADYKATMQTIYTDMQNIQGGDDSLVNSEEPQSNAYGMNTDYSYEEPRGRMVA